MEREVTSTYSINTSQSRISYLSNINNFVHDSNLYNQTNLIEMIYNLRNENMNMMSENLQLVNQISHSMRSINSNSNSNNDTENEDKEGDGEENEIENYNGNENENGNGDDNVNDSDNENQNEDDNENENNQYPNSYTNNNTNNVNNANNRNTNNSNNSIGSFDFFEESSMISNNHGQQSSSIVSSEDPFLEEPNYMLLKTGRAATAPAKPFSEGDEFKWSSQFLNLEKVVLYSNRLISIKGETKIDVDSEEGSEICKKFLDQLEKLIKSLKVKTASRDYRKNFSRAYKCLYQTGNLCYLTEILESAQEGQKSLWVNGEEFSFSKEVLQFGSELHKLFYELLITLRKSHQKIKEDSFHENVQQIKNHLKKELEDFDKKWVNYEQKYINELIFIENESRRHITQAIQIEKEMTNYESIAKCKGKILIESEEYNKIRVKLVNLFSQINKVANTEGKGRDDLTLEILIAAEKVLRKISDNKSKSVRHLAENIKKSFSALRKLLQKYDENIEIVDPQLKNNPELVESIAVFEKAWERGKEFLLDKIKYSQLLFFSQMIEIICEKYKDISEELESREPSIFVWIPSILILKSLEKDDKNICQEFNPNMFDPENEESGKPYIFIQKFKESLYSKIEDNYFAYNLLEKLILYEDKNDACVEKELTKYFQTSYINEFKKKIKILSMQLQRIKPIDWNHFFDLAMNL